MKEDPSVSFLLAAYETPPDYLRKTIDSVLRQSIEDIEIIISDDSSSNSVQDTVLEFEDHRIRYMHNEVALGTASNHWRCIRESSGEYLTILNHDDWVDPSFAQKLSHTLDLDPSLHLVFCDHWVASSTGIIDLDETEHLSRMWGRSTLQAGNQVMPLDLLLRQTIPMAMGAMFRKTSLPRELPARVGPAYDLWLAYVLTRSGLGVSYIPERLSTWRAHAGNQTSRQGKDWVRGGAECWKMMYEDHRLTSVRPAVRRKLALAYYAASRLAHRDQQRFDAAQYALRSLGTRPSIRGLAALAFSALPRMPEAR